MKTNWKVRALSVFMALVLSCSNFCQTIYADTYSLGGKILAGTLTEGEWYPVSLKDGEEIVFEFTAPESGRYVFESSGDYDTVGTLYADSTLENDIANDDDGGDDTNFRIFIEMDEGAIVYLTARKYSGGDSEFSVHVYRDDLAGGEIVGGETIEVTLTEGEWITVNYNTSGDIAFFEFTAPESGEYCFESDSDKNACGYLYNEDNTEFLLFDGGSGEELDFKFTYYLSEGEKVILRVLLFDIIELPDGAFTSGELSGGEFSVRVTRKTEPDPQIGILTGEESSLVTLEAGEEVMFMFTAPESGTYVFESFGTYDTFGVLYGESTKETEIATDDDGGEGHNFRIICRIDEGLTVYLVVGTYSEGTVEFPVMVSELPSITIIDQVGDLHTEEGKPVHLYVSTDSKTEVSYQWYYKLPGAENFTAWPGRTSASFNYTPTASKNGMQLFCIIKDTAGNTVQSNTITLTVSTGLSITKQPEDVTVEIGKSATFAVEASGSGLTYQWYYKLATQSQFTVWGGKTAASFNYTPAESRNGMQLYCEVTDAAGNKVKSEIMTLYVTKPSVTITRQPEDVTIQLGERALFSLEAAGEGLTYQWYYKLGSADFAIWSGRTTASFSYTPTESKNGMQVYCIVTDASGNKVISNTITLKIEKPGAALAITKQPTDVTIQLGEKALFSLEAAGEGLSYQWYYKLGSANFAIWSGRTTASFSYTPTESKNGMQVYCVVTDASGNKVTSNTVTLKIEKPGAALTITKQPTDVTIQLGEKAQFSLEASGEGLTYQWYYKLGSANFAIWSGRTTASFSYTPTESKNGMQVYCVVTDASGNKVTSNTITLKIAKPGDALSITKQPVDITIKPGEKALFSLEASGEGLTYQWYYKLGSANFAIWSGRTTASFSYTPTESKNGMQVYCVVSDASGNKVTSNTITLKIQSESTVTGPKIKKDPVNTSCAAGGSVRIAVEASGEGLTYQWYVKLPGKSSFELWSGRTAAAFSYSMTAAKSGMQVYCVVTDRNGQSVTSKTAVMTVV